MKKICLILSIFSLLVVACSTTSLFPATPTLLVPAFGADGNAFGSNITTHRNALIYLDSIALDDTDSAHSDNNQHTNFYRVPPPTGTMVPVDIRPSDLHFPNPADAARAGI